MKKLLCLILAVLTLVSCTDSGNSGRQINKSPEYIRELTESPYTDALNSTDRLVIPKVSRYLAYSIESLAVPAPEYPPDGSTASTAPAVCFSGEELVMIRNYPPEIFTSEEAYMSHKDAADRFVIREIEFHSYATGETCTLPVTGLENRHLFVRNLAHNPDGSFSLIAQEWVNNRPAHSLFIRLDAEGALMAEYPFTHTENAACRMLNDTVYTVLPDGYSITRNDLTAKNYATGEETVIDRDVFSIDLHGTMLYYMTEEMNEDFEYEVYFKVFGISDSSVREIDRIPAHHTRPNTVGFDSIAFSSFLYCPGTGMLYLETRGSDQYDLYACCTETGAVTGVMEADSYAAPVCASEDAIAVMLAFQQIYIFSGTDKSPETVESDLPQLNVCVNSSSSKSFVNAADEALTAMKKNELPLRVNQVVEVNSEKAYVNTMAKKLLAGDTDFDIFEVTTEMLDLLKEGYYEDLSRYPLLNSYFGCLNPGVREMCEVGGITALVPRTLKTPGLNVAGSITVPDTLDALLSLSADTVLLSGQNASSILRPWFDQISANYLAGRMDDDAALEKLTALFEKMPSVSAGENGSGILTTASITSDTAGRITDTVPLPLADETCGRAFTASFYAVNPCSPNRELAALFLAYSMETSITGDGMRTSGSMLYRDYTPKRGMESRYEAFRESLASGVILYESSDLSSAYTDAAREAQSGSVTPTDAAAQVFRMMKMIRYE